MLNIYAKDLVTGIRELLMACPTWNEDNMSALSELSSESLGKALVMNLFDYKRDFYQQIYAKAKELYDKGDESACEKILNEITLQRIDFYENFSDRVGNSDSHFMKMKVYDFNIAPYILLGYMKEIDWTKTTVEYEVTDELSV